MVKQLASEEQWAAMDFQPWQHTEGEWTPPSNDEMINRLLVPTHLAWHLLYKSKTELVDSTRKLIEAGDAEGEDLLGDLIEQLNGTGNNYRILSDLVEGAVARLLIAATVVEREERANS